MLLNTTLMLQPALALLLVGTFEIILVIAITLLVLGVGSAVYKITKATNATSSQKPTPTYNYNSNNENLASTKSKVEQLKELNSLLQNGLIDHADFEEQKKRILDS